MQALDLQGAEAGPALPGALEGKVGNGVAAYLAYFGAPATGMLMEALIASGVDFGAGQHGRVDVTGLPPQRPGRTHMGRP